MTGLSTFHIFACLAIFACLRIAAFPVFQPVLEATPAQCPPNERFSICSVSCNTCEKRGECDDTTCKPRCDCKLSYYRNSTGICVHVSECPRPFCGENEVYLDCGPRCQSCRHLKCAMISCSYKCYCKPGFQRNRQGKCIRSSACPRGRHCPFNEVFRECGPVEEYCGQKSKEMSCEHRCYCKDGFQRNIAGQCIPAIYCPRSICPKTQSFFKCVPTFESACSNLRDNSRPSNETCFSGCFCKSGTVMNNEGLCVPKEECKGHQEIFALPDEDFTLEESDFNEIVPVKNPSSHVSETTLDFTESSFPDKERLRGEPEEIMAASDEVVFPKTVEYRPSTTSVPPAATLTTEKVPLGTVLPPFHYIDDEGLHLDMKESQTSPPLETSPLDETELASLPSTSIPFTPETPQNQHLAATELLNKTEIEDSIQQNDTAKSYHEQNIKLKDDETVISQKSEIFPLLLLPPPEEPFSFQTWTPPPLTFHPLPVSSKPDYFPPVPFMEPFNFSLPFLDSLLPPQVPPVIPQPPPITIPSLPPIPDLNLPSKSDGSASISHDPTMSPEEWPLISPIEPPIVFPPGPIVFPQEPLPGNLTYGKNEPLNTTTEPAGIRGLNNTESLDISSTATDVPVTTGPLFESMDLHLNQTEAVRDKENLPAVLLFVSSEVKQNETTKEFGAEEDETKSVEAVVGAQQPKNLSTGVESKSFEKKITLQQVESQSTADEIKSADEIVRLKPIKNQSTEDESKSSEGIVRLQVENSGTEDESKSSEGIVRLQQVTNRSTEDESKSSEGIVRLQQVTNRSTEDESKSSEGIVRLQQVTNRSTEDESKSSEGIVRLQQVTNRSTEDESKSSEGIVRLQQVTNRSTEDESKSSEGIVRLQQVTNRSTEDESKSSEGIVRLQQVTNRSTEDESKSSEGIVRLQQVTNRSTEDESKSSEGIVRLQQVTNRSTEDESKSSEGIVRLQQVTNRSTEGESKSAEGTVILQQVKNQSTENESKSSEGTVRLQVENQGTEESESPKEEMSAHRNEATLAGASSVQQNKTILGQLHRLKTDITKATGKSGETLWETFETDSSPTVSSSNRDKKVETGVTHDEIDLDVNKEPKTYEKVTKSEEDSGTNPKESNTKQGGNLGKVISLNLEVEWHNNTATLNPLHEILVENQTETLTYGERPTQRNDQVSQSLLGSSSLIGMGKGVDQDYVFNSQHQVNDSGRQNGASLRTLSEITALGDERNEFNQTHSKVIFLKADTQHVHEEEQQPATFTGNRTETSEKITEYDRASTRSTNATVFDVETEFLPQEKAEGTERTKGDSSETETSGTRSEEELYTSENSSDYKSSTTNRTSTSFYRNAQKEALNVHSAQGLKENTKAHSVNKTEVTLDEYKTATDSARVTSPETEITPLLQESETHTYSTDSSDLEIPLSEGALSKTWSTRGNITSDAAIVTSGLKARKGDFGITHDLVSTPKSPSETISRIRDGKIFHEPRDETDFQTTDLLEQINGSAVISDQALEMWQQPDVMVKDEISAYGDSLVSKDNVTAMIRNEGMTPEVKEVISDNKTSTQLLISETAAAPLFQDAADVKTTENGKPDYTRLLLALQQEVLTDGDQQQRTFNGTSSVVQNPKVKSEEVGIHDSLVSTIIPVLNETFIKQVETESHLPDAVAFGSIMQTRDSLGMISHEETENPDKIFTASQAHSEPLKGTVDTILIHDGQSSADVDTVISSPLQMHNLTSGTESGVDKTSITSKEGADLEISTLFPKSKQIKPDDKFIGSQRKSESMTEESAVKKDEKITELPADESPVKDYGENTESMTEEFAVQKNETITEHSADESLVKDYGENPNIPDKFSGSMLNEKELNDTWTISHIPYSKDTEANDFNKSTAFGGSSSLRINSDVPFVFIPDSTGIPRKVDGNLSSLFRSALPEINPDVATTLEESEEQTLNSTDSKVFTGTDISSPEEGRVMDNNTGSIRVVPYPAKGNFSSGTEEDSSRYDRGGTYQPTNKTGISLSPPYLELGRASNISVTSYAEVNTRDLNPTDHQEKGEESGPSSKDSYLKRKHVLPGETDAVKNATTISGDEDRNADNKGSNLTSVGSTSVDNANYRMIFPGDVHLTPASSNAEVNIPDFMASTTDEIYKEHNDSEGVLKEIKNSARYQGYLNQHTALEGEAKHSENETDLLPPKKDNYTADGYFKGGELAADTTERYFDTAEDFPGVSKVSSSVNGDGSQSKVTNKEILLNTGKGFSEEHVIQTHVNKSSLQEHDDDTDSDDNDDGYGGVNDDDDEKDEQEDDDEVERVGEKTSKLEEKTLISPTEFEEKMLQSASKTGDRNPIPHFPISKFEVALAYSNNKTDLLLQKKDSQAMQRPLIAREFPLETTKKYSDAAEPSGVPDVKTYATDSDVAQRKSTGVENLAGVAKGSRLATTSHSANTASHLTHTYKSKSNLEEDDDDEEEEDDDDDEEEDDDDEEEDDDDDDEEDEDDEEQEDGDGKKRASPEFSTVEVESPTEDEKKLLVSSSDTLSSSKMKSNVSRSTSKEHFTYASEGFANEEGTPGFETTKDQNKADPNHQLPTLPYSEATTLPLDNGKQSDEPHVVFPSYGPEETSFSKNNSDPLNLPSHFTKEVSTDISSSPLNSDGNIKHSHPKTENSEEDLEKEEYHPDNAGLLQENVNIQSQNLSKDLHELEGILVSKEQQSSSSSTREYIGFHNSSNLLNKSGMNFDDLKITFASIEVTERSKIDESGRFHSTHSVTNATNQTGTVAFLNKTRIESQNMTSVSDLRSPTFDFVDPRGDKLHARTTISEEGVIPEQKSKEFSDLVAPASLAFPRVEVSRNSDIKVSQHGVIESDAQKSGLSTSEEETDRSDISPNSTVRPVNEMDSFEKIQDKTFPTSSESGLYTETLPLVNTDVSSQVQTPDSKDEASRNPDITQSSILNFSFNSNVSTPISISQNNSEVFTQTITVSQGLVTSPPEDHKEAVKLSSESDPAVYRHNSTELGSEATEQGASNLQTEKSFEGNRDLTVNTKTSESTANVHTSETEDLIDDTLQLPVGNEKKTGNISTVFVHNNNRITGNLSSNSTKSNFASVAKTLSTINTFTHKTASATQDSDTTEFSDRSREPLTSVNPFETTPPMPNLEGPKELKMAYSQNTGDLIYDGVVASSVKVPSVNVTEAASGKVHSEAAVDLQFQKSESDAVGVPDITDTSSGPLALQDEGISAVEPDPSSEDTTGTTKVEARNKQEDMEREHRDELFTLGVTKPSSIQDLPLERDVILDEGSSKARLPYVMAEIMPSLHSNTSETTYTNSEDVLFSTEVYPDYINGTTTVLEYNAGDKDIHISLPFPSFFSDPNAEDGDTYTDSEVSVDDKT